MIGKQVLAFGKSEKSEFINIGIFAASSGGCEGRLHVGRFTPDHMCMAFLVWQQKQYTPFLHTCMAVLYALIEYN